MTSVKVGIIGAGANTRRKHIPGLLAIPGVEIIGVCNRTRESSKRVADEFRIPKVYDNWREPIDDEETNAIVIGTWPYLHCRASIAALQAGKHVMTEARMARNALEAYEMLSTAQANPHLVAQVVPSPFTLHVDKTIQRLLAQGFIGQVLVIESHQEAGFLDRDSLIHWRQDADLSGAKVLALGIWYEAIMRWVGEATSVMARGKTFVKTRKDEAGRLRAVRVPEHIDVIADMACGAQMHIQQSAVTAHLQGGGIYLFGDEGVLRFHDGRLFGARRSDKALAEIEVPPEERGAWRVEEEFVNAIRGIEPVRLTNFEDGFKYMEFTGAVAQSMATGKSVSLPLEFAG